MTTTPCRHDVAVEVAAEQQRRAEDRIRVRLELLIEDVRDSDMADRDVAIGHLGQARNWLRVREEHQR